MIINIPKLSYDKYNLALSQYGTKLKNRKSYEEIKEDELYYLNKYKPLPKLEQRSILTVTEEELDSEQKEKVLSNNADLLALFNNVDNSNSDIIEDTEIKSEYEEMYDDTRGIADFRDKLLNLSTEDVETTESEDFDEESEEFDDESEDFDEESEEFVEEPVEEPEEFDEEPEEFDEELITTETEESETGVEEIENETSDSEFDDEPEEFDDEPEEFDDEPTISDEDYDSSIDEEKPDIQEVSPNNILGVHESEIEDSEEETLFDDEFDDEEDSSDDNIEGINDQQEEIIQEVYEEVEIKPITPQPKKSFATGRTAQQKMNQPVNIPQLEKPVKTKTTKTTTQKPISQINIPKAVLPDKKVRAIDKLKSDYINSPEVIPREVKGFVSRYRGIKYSDAKQYISPKEIDKALRQGEIILKNNRLW